MTGISNPEPELNPGDSSSQTTVRRPYLSITEVLFGILIMAGLYLISVYSYLLFHSLVEVFGIVVAFTIFLLAWHSRRFIDNNYFIIVGIAFLFISFMTLLHTLAYKGMGVFVGYDANLPTQLWIATRYLEAITFFIAPLLLGRKLKYNFVFIGYTVVTSILLASIFYLNIFPDCFVEGVGLTAFKKISEYIISLLLLFSLYLLFQKRNNFDTEVLHLLSAAIIVSVFAELAFTFYISVYGFSNLVGHFLRFISFYLFYKAIIEKALTKPYDILFRSLKQNENALRETRDYLEKLIDYTNAPFIVWNPELEITRVNHAFEHLTGYTANELMHKKLHMLFPDSSRQESLNEIKRTLSGEQWESVEIPIFHKDGTIRLTLWNSANLYGEDGTTVQAIIAQGIDITERKQAEDALKMSEKLLRTIAANFPHSYISIIEKDLTIGFSSGKEFENQNLDPESYVGLTIYEVFGEQTPIVKENYLKTFDGEENTFELFINNQHQQYNTVPLYDENGEIQRILVVVENITERKQAEKMLHISFEKRKELEFIVNRSPVIVFLWKAEEGWPVEFVSENIEQFGYTTQDFMEGRIPYADIIHSEDLERVGDEVSMYSEQGVKEFAQEYRIITKSGDVRWTDDQTWIRRDPDGKITHYQGIVVDITERRQVEEAMRLHGEMLENMGEGVYLIRTSDGIIVYANPRFEEMFGYEYGEMIGQNVSIVNAPTDISPEEKVKVLMEKLMKDGVWHGEIQNIKKDGTTFWCHANVSVFDHSEYGEVLVAVHEDITQRKEAEESLKKYAEDLKHSNELKDLFTDILRHDLLNPAGLVRGFTEIIIEKEKDEEKQYILQKIANNNNKLINLIESAATFAKLESIEELRFETKDIGKIFNNVVTNFRPNLDEKHLVLDFKAERTYPAKVNPVIEEVFANLLSNAIKYSPNESRIIIEILDSDDKWKVTVTDFGEGILDDDKTSLFERFKRVGKGDVKGTGLGLAIVKRIIELHGGDVGVEDNPAGKGSVFWVTVNKA